MFFSIRRFVHFIVSSPRFDNTILALILISSGLLAVEDATDPNAMVNIVRVLCFGDNVLIVSDFARKYWINDELILYLQVLKYMDYGFTSIFALEVVLKVILIIIKCILILSYLFQFLVASVHEIIDFKLLAFWYYKISRFSQWVKEISELFCLIIGGSYFLSKDDRIYLFH